MGIVENPGPGSYTTLQPNNFKELSAAQLRKQQMTSNFKSEQVQRKEWFSSDPSYPSPMEYNTSEWKTFGSQQLQGGSPNNVLTL